MLKTPWQRASTRCRHWTTALCAAAAMLPGLALGDTWPDKPVRVLVGFPPGGAADQIARAVATPLHAALGQPVVIENRAGAGGNIGADAVAKSTADGYTFLFSSGGTVSINPLIYKNMGFDPVKDLAPVASVARVLLYLEAHPDVPADDAQGFVQYLRDHPGKLSYGSPGNGSSPHIAGEMLKHMAKVDALHVPYRGAAPALQDLLAGQVDFMFDPGVGLQHVKAGRLKLLAVGSATRSRQFPDVPTLAEIGLAGYDADTVFGFYAPAGTPREVIDRMNAAIREIVQSDAFDQAMQAIGAEPMGGTPEEFAQRMREETGRFGEVIAAQGIAGD